MFNPIPYSRQKGGARSTMRKLVPHIGYIFELPWNFLAKFWHSNKKVQWKYFYSLCLKFETSAHVQLV